MTPADMLGESRILVSCQAPWSDGHIDWEGFKERDLRLLESQNGIVHHISAQRLTEFAPDVIERSWLDRSDTFQQLINCTQKTEIVLIGKDGGVKKRWSNKVPADQFLDDLFQTIDAMPMRQYEMQTRGAN